MTEPDQNRFAQLKASIFNKQITEVRQEAARVASASGRSARFKSSIAAKLAKLLDHWPDGTDVPADLVRIYVSLATGRIERSNGRQEVDPFARLKESIQVRSMYQVEIEKARKSGVKSPSDTAFENVAERLRMSDKWVRGRYAIQKSDELLQPDE